MTQVQLDALEKHEHGVAVFDKALAGSKAKKLAKLLEDASDGECKFLTHVALIGFYLVAFK
jgi:hypothetical protein